MNNVHFLRKHRRALLLGVALGTTCWLPLLPAHAGGLSEASALSTQGSATIVQGSVAGVTGSANLVVEAVEWLVDGVKVTLRGSAAVGRVVLMLPVNAVGAVSLAAGQTVEIVTEGTGWLIRKAGQAIAYVPNQAGRALLSSEPVTR